MSELAEELLHTDYVDRGKSFKQLASEKIPYKA
jgi:hypothetical protein